MKSAITFTAMGIVALLQAANGPASGVVSRPPPLPYADQGACPFECCTYRKWTVLKPFTLHERPDDESNIVSRHPGDGTVEASTGVVITRVAAEIRILKKMRLGNEQGTDTPGGLELEPGEIVYALHYLGEGYSLFWVRGKLLEAGEIDPRLVANAEQTEYRVITEFEYEWWARIVAADGKAGWALVREQFGNMDACG